MCNISIAFKAQQKIDQFVHSFQLVFVARHRTCRKHTSEVQVSESPGLRRKIVNLKFHEEFLCFEAKSRVGVMFFKLIIKPFSCFLGVTSVTS